MRLKAFALVFILLGIAIAGLSFKNKKDSPEFSEEELTKVSVGKIQITAVYLNPKYPELTNATFYIRLDTHSGDLYRFDLKNSVVLEVNGKVFKPLSWKEDKKSWQHHRYGLMEFSKEALKEINMKMEFKLKINIDGERVLQWKA